MTQPAPTAAQRAQAMMNDEVALHIGRETLARIAAQTDNAVLQQDLARTRAAVEDLQARVKPEEPEDPPAT